MPVNNIGTNVQFYRQKRNISQSELADRLNLSSRQIGEIEAGNSFSTIDTLNSIAQSLDIPLDVLFKDCDKSFLVYAIEDYLNMLNKDQAKDVLTDLLDMMEGRK